MRIRPWSPLIAAAALLAVTSVSSCSLCRAGWAWLHSGRPLPACTPDSRIQCESGSEVLAAEIASKLDEALRQVEERQYRVFPQAVVIRTYASARSFSTHSGAPGAAAGAVAFGILHVSPKLAAQTQRQRAVLTHELSHLHLFLTMGADAWSRLPGWFHEGLATWVADGGGAETVSVDDAWREIRRGHRFTPESSGSIWRLRSASSYGLSPHLYYRQAALFIGYLHDRDTVAFRRMLLDVEARRPLADAVAAAYAQTLERLWDEFCAFPGAPPAHGVG